MVKLSKNQRGKGRRLGPELVSRQDAKAQRKVQSPSCAALRGADFSQREKFYQTQLNSSQREEFHLAVWLAPSPGGLKSAV